MADPEHVVVLGQGIKAWNTWRKKHPEIHPDLRKADLSETQRIGADFRRTNLSGANLRSAILSSVHLNDSEKKSGPLRRSRRGHHHSHDKDLIRDPSLLLCSPAIIKMALYALAIGAPTRCWRKDSHD